MFKFEIVIVYAVMAVIFGNKLALSKGDSILPLASRIISGQLADITQFPWQVSINSFSALTLQDAFCGGSLIHPHWILTSSQCTRLHYGFYVRLGSSGLTYGGYYVYAEKAIQHPSYDPAKLNNNVALLKLFGDITLSSKVQPIRLPHRAQQSQTFVGANCLVSGFGLTSDSSNKLSNQLNYVGIRTISNVECTKTYGSNIVIESTICGFGKNKPTESFCRGDEGGALVIEGDGNWTQIGISSFVYGYNRCSYGFPSGYVRTAHFVDWIQEVTGIPVRD